MDIEKFLNKQMTPEERITNLENDIKILNANRAKTSKPNIIRNIDSLIHSKQRSINHLKEKDSEQTK